MITFSSSFEQFLAELKDKGNAVARLLLWANRYHDVYPAYRKLITNEEVDYITIRNDGMLSFLPAGKEHKVTDAGQWSRENRQSGKPAKIIRKMFREKALRFINQTAFEAFGNEYKAKFLDNGYKFQLRDRNEICDVYEMRRAPGDASLNGSCMNGDSEYMEIYTACKSANILTLMNKNDDLCGRALVWKVDREVRGGETETEKITFMDRIYVAEDYMYDIFLNYAKEQGWWRKRDYKSFENKRSWINPATDEVESVVVRINTSTDFKRYPYIDTFTYGEDGFITNESGYTYTYTETGGSREGGESEDDDHDDDAYDEVNEEYISADNAVYLCDRGERRYRSRTTHVNNAVQARVRRSDTEWFHNEDENIVSIRGRWYYTGNDDVVCKADGDYALYDDCVQCETDQEYYDEDDSDMLRAENGCYYHKQDDDNVIYVQGHGEQSIHSEYLYLPDHEGEVNKATDGNWYYTHDNRVTQVVDDEDSSWFVIEHDAPKMIVQVDGQWHHRADVADVTVYNCNDKGERWTTIEHYLQKDERVTFIESLVGKDKHKELGWYLKDDLIKYRNKYYRKDDQRMLIRVINTVTPTKRKRATVSK